MVKICCDICGKEIAKVKEVWKLSLLSKSGNRRVSYDEKVADVCESCATQIHCCLSALKNGLKPKFDCIPEKGDGNG